ncbi:MAG: outer membrane beta-barrel protein [Sediminibacterium sp.]|nr:outer membrane beta-barrel protein [Sediminibacterium sp.]
MKNFFYTSLAILALSTTTFAQQNAAEEQSEFDKRWRFGLRIAPQPTWFKSGNGNTAKLKGGFGFGFGLVIERKLSDLIRISTGIGGDFESGSVSYRNDGYDPNNPSTNNNFAVAYVIDNSGELVEPKAGLTRDKFDYQTGTKSYILKERTIKTTHVTIPVTLKMMTKEYSGFRYFGQFGIDVGFRTAFKASDVYSYTGTYAASTSTANPNGTIVWTAGGTNGTVPISKDGSIVPVRLGLNVGAGTEYRIAGSTSLFLSVNYFSSFTNLMRGDSKYAYTAASYDAPNNKYTSFAPLVQSLKMNAIRINLGVMF